MGWGYLNHRDMIHDGMQLDLPNVFWGMYVGKCI